MPIPQDPRPDRRRVDTTEAHPAEESGTRARRRRRQLIEGVDPRATQLRLPPERDLEEEEE